MQKLKYTIIIMLFCFYAHAQKWEIGGGMGASNTRTDVSTFNFLNTRYAFQGFLRYNFDHAWVARLDAKYFSLYGSDKNNSTQIAAIRNYTFSDNGAQVTANMEYNFLDFRDLKRKVKFSPFLTAGIGACFFKVSNTALSAFSPCIPFGMGAKYMINKNWNIGALFETTKTFTDRIDGIDATFPEEMDPHIKSADLSTDDWYYFFGITISYTFYHIKCPDHHDKIMRQALPPNKREEN